MESREDRVVEALPMPACDCVEHHEDFRLSEVRWGDGRVDLLTAHCSEEADDRNPRSYQEELPEITHVGFFSEGGMPFSYFATTVSQVSPDVFLLTEGDNDEVPSATYLRGSLEDVAWAGLASDLPVEQLLLADHLVLLDDVAEYEGCYPVLLFGDMDDPRYLGATLNVTDEAEAAMMEILKERHPALVEAAAQTGPGWDDWRARRAHMDELYGEVTD